METKMQNELIEILEKQEELLVFEKFDEDDAWNIGNSIRQKIIAYGGSAAVDITCGDMCLFSCCVAKLTPHNLTWIVRERNTVMEFWQSSYRVALNLKQMGKTLEERGLASIDYAVSGGGFPIRLRQSGVIGAIVVSGMDQAVDHQFIVDAIGAYLNKTVPSVGKLYK